VSSIKYPRTSHLPWSLGISSDDVLLSTTYQFKGKQVVVTEKMDGENTTITSESVYARSPDSMDHPSRSWVKGLAGKIQFEIPKGWRICGENLYAKHSIEYSDLPSYFLVFSIWDKRNFCLSWDDTKEYAGILGLCTVRELYRGLFNEDKIKKIRVNTTRQEGYVVRTMQGFSYNNFKNNVAKYVRKGHVTTDQHWSFMKVIPNKLKT